MCKKATKGNKKIGIYRCELTGRGMKVKNRQDDDETDDEAEQATLATDAINQQQEGPNDEEVEIQFNKIICDDADGFLKMDGVNGPFVQWRYMTLEIKKIKKNKN